MRLTTDASGTVILVPRPLALAVAHGLAGGRHWWIAGDSPPDVRTMADVMRAHEESDAEEAQRANVSWVGSSQMTWRPFLAGPDSRRFIEITFDGHGYASVEWDTGTGESSAFIGRLLRTIGVLGELKESPYFD